MAADPHSSPAAAASTPPRQTADGRPLPWPLFAGFAVASIGGPIALPSLLPSTIGEGGIRSSGLVVALSLLVFAAPLAIWWRYSERVASPGGLSAFVAAAAGRRAGQAHAYVWAVAYFLYLPYTVTYVVYDVLPPVLPGIDPYRAALELAIPVALVLVALAPVRAVLTAVAALGALQLVALLVLAGVEYGHTRGSFAGTPTLDGTGRGTGNAALLFVCASLPLYLGAEVGGGARTVRRGVVGAVGVVGAASLVAVIPLSAVPDALRSSAVPGFSIAQAYGGRGFGVTIGLLTAAGALGLIVAEYLALGRLLRWQHGLPLRTTLAWIGVPFVTADVISLVDPDGFYDDLLKPSLAALYTSQLVVFLVFPRFRRSAPAVVLAGVAAALSAWGMYVLFAGGGSS